MFRFRYLHGLLLIKISLSTSWIFPSKIPSATIICPPRATTTSRRQSIQVLVASLVCSSGLPRRAYGSNLPTSTGADTSNYGTVQTLVPLVELQKSIGDLKAQTASPSFSPKDFQIGKDIPTSENEFKKLFDAYSDPVSYKQKFVDQNAFLVYYSKGFDGPGRPNIESDLPVKQTLQYGARNDAWVAMEELLVEIQFAKQDDSPYDKDDLLQPLQKLLQSLDAYLSLAPEMDLKNAEKIVSGR